CYVLLLDRSVPVAPTPFPYRFREPADSAGCRPFLDCRVVLPRLPPVMGEPQEVKRPQGVSLLRSPSSLLLLGPRERHQSRLVRVDRQPVLTETLRQHLHHPSCVGLVGEPDYEV